MDFIHFKEHTYPYFQALGNASQFSIPYAKHYCKGIGYDIGFCKEEWKFPGAIGIDLSLDNGYHADNLPEEQVDYIYSSHCLEHVDNWVNTLELWLTKLNTNGILFLYLPDFSQVSSKVLNCSGLFNTWQPADHLSMIVEIADGLAR